MTMYCAAPVAAAGCFDDPFDVPLEGAADVVELVLPPVTDNCGTNGSLATKCEVRTAGGATAVDTEEGAAVVPS